MSELTRRILSAVVLIPLVLVVTLWEGSLPFAVAVYVLILLGTMEIIQIFQKAGKAVSKVLVWFGAVTIPLCFQIAEGWLLFGILVVILITLAFLFKMFSQDPTGDVIGYVSVNTFAAIFFPLLFSFLWLIRMMPGGGLWVLFTLVTVWSADSCAYFIGKKFGKRKIVPKISPKKSLEGFIAGLAGGVIMALAFYYLFLHNSVMLPVWKILMISVDIVIAGMLGDLFESMCKRSAGVKDSGKIFPGHGGVFDRVDSLLFAAPVLYIYLRIFVGN